MNIYEPLPDKAGEYKIYTDFRVWLSFGETCQKHDIIGVLKVYKQLPPKLETAIELAVSFYGGAALPYKNTTKNRKSTSSPTVDFLFDNQLIFAAFMAQYGINLNAARLHWYEFCALFYGLSGQAINDIMGYRAAEADKIIDKDRRREIKRLKRIYALPDNRTPEQRDRDNAANIAALF